MRPVRQAVAQTATVSVALVIALGLRPASVREIVAAYVLALTAIALLLLTRIARDAEEWERSSSEFERALAPRRVDRVRPAELIRGERDLVLANGNAGDLHSRLLPQLRDVATARLADRGVRLADARGLLGEDAWALLRSDRPPPADRGQPGLSLKQIAALFDRIEEL